jgi:hypothetical protein
MSTQRPDWRAVDDAAVYKGEYGNVAAHNAGDTQV